MGRLGAVIHLIGLLSTLAKSPQPRKQGEWFEAGYPPTVGHMFCPLFRVEGVAMNNEELSSGICLLFGP